MKKFNLLLLLGFIFINSCSSMIITRIIKQDFSSNQISSNSKKKTIDAITYVLVNNGFEIDLVNDSFGLINTKWRQVRNDGDFWTGLAVSVLSKGGNYTSYEREMSIQIRITENGYETVPKLKFITKRSNAFNTSSNDNIIYPVQESNEAKLTIKMVQEINQLLNIPNSYRWEEKKIISE